MYQTKMANNLFHPPQLDYSESTGKKYDKIPRDDFLRMSSSPDNFGGLLDCSHLIGGSKFEKHSDDRAEGHHQINVTYRRWVDENRKEVEAESEGLLIMTHHYVKFDGVWKLCGTTAHGRLGDLKLDKVFRGFA
jgi:scytalone dehydratase